METSETLPIVDAHQHFWDLSRNYHPWLCDPEPIPFRYGDYSRLKRSYMPADYRRDSAGFDIVKTVYVEAEWDPKTPLAETRWVEAVAAEYGLPSAVVAQAWLDRADAAEVLAGQAARPIVRGIRHTPAAAPPARWMIRDGGAPTCSSNGTGCPSTCRRRGGTLMPQRSSGATSRRRRSSSTTPACRPTARPRASPAGGAVLRPSRRARTRRSRSPASAGPACPGRSRRTAP